MVNVQISLDLASVSSKLFCPDLMIIAHAEKKKGSYNIFSKSRDLELMTSPARV